MQDYIEQLIETLEGAREYFEEASLEGMVVGDTTNLMELFNDITEELEAHRCDENQDTHE